MNQPKQTKDSSIRITMSQGGYRHYQQLQIPRRRSLMIQVDDAFVKGVTSG